MQDLEIEIARVLLEVQAVRFQPHDPVTFKSGIIAPIYVDNRILPFHPMQWEKVIRGFYKRLMYANIQFDIIAGIETAGIPHSAVLGYTVQRPSVFVRKAAKEHGQKRQVEGGDVAQKRVLLIEDMVTTGGSSLHGVAMLRAAGAQVTDCLAIISYDLLEATQAFERAQVTLHTLTTFPVVLEEAQAAGHLLNTEAAIVRDWLTDPYGWAANNGFAK